MKLEELSIQTPLYVADACDRFFDPKVPFYASVRQSPFSSRPSVHLTEFRLFLQLPQEIQLMVLRECDRPTLFDLMHTCSSTRKWAKQLFWSDQGTWYLFGDELCRGQFGKDNPFDVGPPHLCLQFAAHVEQIEVLFDWVFDHVREKSTRPFRACPEKSRSFWTLLLKHFPALKCVVLSEGEAPDIIPHSTDRPLRPLKFAAMIRAAPPQINIFVSPRRYMDHATLRTEERKLYRLDENSQFALLKSPWTRYRVTLPTDKIPGPVGEWLEDHRRARDLTVMCSALKHIRLEAHEKYHFGGGRNIPFKCPSPDCEATFSRVGQFTEHITSPYYGYDSHHQWRPHIIWTSPDFRSALPVELETQLDQIRVAYVEAKKRASQALALLREKIGDRDSEKRIQWVESFQAQLEREPIWNEGKTPMRLLYSQSMSHFISYFDRYPEANPYVEGKYCV